MNDVIETPVPQPIPQALKAPIEVSVVEKAQQVVEAPKEASPPTAEPPVEQVKKKDSIATKLAHLKAKEAEIAQREQELAAKESGLTEKEKAIVNSEAFAEAMKANPLKALEAAGITFEQLTEAVLANDSTAQTRDMLTKLGERLKGLEEFRDAKMKEEEEAKIKAEQEYIDRTVADFKRRTKEYVTSKPEDYELLIANEAYDLVYEVVEEYWGKHGKILPGQDAANAVEKWLEEKVKKLTGTRKLKSLLGTDASDKQTKEPVRTLTGQSGNVVPAQSVHIPDRDESLRRAASLLRFN